MTDIENKKKSSFTPSVN
jgi:hypothetical protein